MNCRDTLPRFLKSLGVLIGVAVVCLSAAATTATAAGVYIYDTPQPARVDARAFGGAEASSAQLSDVRVVSASSQSSARGTVTNPYARVVATEEGPSFFRGAKPGEAPSFEPRPNDFKVDPATGTVKPTHGVSVFDNPGSVTSKGFVPHEVDLSSVPPELQIIQRGADPAHFEIMPQVGANLSPEQYKGLMCQIVCK